MAKLNVEVFADGADIEEMKAAYKNKQVDGFTTNPSLMAKAGVTDYKAFAEEAVKEIPDASISFEVFAGRIADTGVDPLPLMKEAVKVTHSKDGVKLLWASCRELFNVIQADEIGADIITCPADVVKKVNTNLGRDINELSVDTVKGFAKDIQSSGLSIL